MSISVYKSINKENPVKLSKKEGYQGQRHEEVLDDNTIMSHLSPQGGPPPSITTAMEVCMCEKIFTVLEQTI